MIEIRQCTLEDIQYIYEISYATGLDGGPANEVCKDPLKVGHYFSAPYLHFEIDICFVATVDNIPKGYVLGTTDTIKYTNWLNSTWLPKIRTQYDFGTSDNLHPLEAFLNDVIQNDTKIDKDLIPYPGHLHIDILPELQGRGMGRKLMETFFKRCREKEVSKVHLVVSKDNPGAMAFYKKMGMYEICDYDDSLALGYDL